MQSPVALTERGPKWAVFGPFWLTRFRRFGGNVRRTQIGSFNGGP
jgi:hypothetical protein